MNLHIDEISQVRRSIDQVQTLLNTIKADLKRVEIYYQIKESYPVESRKVMRDEMLRLMLDIEEGTLKRQRYDKTLNLVILFQRINSNLITKKIEEFKELTYVEQLFDSLLEDFGRFGFSVFYHYQIGDAFSKYNDENDEGI